MERKKANQSGRVAFDERGCAIWEWRTEDDQFARDIETARFKALQDDALTLANTGEQVAPQFGFNPYDTGRGMQPTGRRRSLDDMRALNEQIKAKQRASKDKATP